MNMKTIVWFTLSAAALVAGAMEYEWTNAAADGDWTNERNFSPNGLPGAADDVMIRAGTTITLVYDTSEAAKIASCEAFAGVGRIVPAANSSVIDITVPDGETLTLGCAIATTLSATPANLKGVVNKRGNGTLVCSSETKLTNSTTSFDYATHFNVFEGMLKLPTGASGKKCACRSIALRENATLFTPQDVQLVVLSGIESDYGSSIVNGSTGLCTLTLQNGSKASIAGTVSGGIVFHVTGGALALCGDANTNTNVDVLVQENENDLSANASGVLSFARLGKKAVAGVPSASSIGYAENVILHLKGGGLRYLGDGEETDKTITIHGTSDVFNFIDAGAVGGIDFTGHWTMTRESTKDFRMKRLVLTGSNTTAAVMSGIIDSPKTSRFGNTNYTFRITKCGTGKWTMKHNDESDMRGVFAVKDGTLAFDTLAEKGVNSALGKSTILQEDVANVIVDPAIYGVDYAFLLGDGATRGTLEYVGTTNCASATRLFSMDGEGAMLNNGGGFLRLAGFNALAGTTGATLVLGGSNTLDNVADDIADGEGARLSVVKEGAGTWRIGTNLTFTGSLVVKDGRLIVGPPPYTWYRWTLKGNFFTPEGSANGRKGSSAERLVGAAALGLFDGSGANQATNLDDSAYFSWSGANYVNSTLTYATLPAVFAEAADVTQFLSLEPGECRLAESGANTYSASSTTVGNLFDGNGGTFFRMSNTKSASQLIPVPTNATSWRVVELRLPEGARPVSSYDFASIPESDLKQNIHIAKLEGSVNGKDWDALDEITNSCPLSGFVWSKTGTAFPEAEGTAHVGYPIAPAPGGQTAFSATSVRVDSGATLVASTTNIFSVARIEVDANGMGSLFGFALAEGGTIAVVNPKEDKSYAIDVDFTNVSMPEAYSIVVDDGCGLRTASLSPDRRSILVHPRGFVILLQ